MTEHLHRAAVEAGREAAKWAPGSRLRTVLFSVGIVVAVIMMPSLVMYLAQLGPDFRFTLQDDWISMCLGDEEAVASLLAWDEAEVAEPEILRDDLHDASVYTCDWVWHSASNQGQLLTISVEVRDWSSFEPYEKPGSGTVDIDNWPSSGWSSDYEVLDGWENGICIQHWGTSSDEYRCVASEENLRLTVKSEPKTYDTPHDSKYFGPGGKSVEDLTVELGELVRETFAR